MESALKEESSLIIQYLSGAAPREEEIQLYIQAIKQLKPILSPIDLRLFNIVKRFPFLFPAIDSGAALLFPKSQFRYRILIQLAILETSANYSHLFLHNAQQKLSFFKFFLHGLLAVCLAIIGCLVLFPIKIFARGN